jgi:hypothetical protein
MSGLQIIPIKDRRWNEAESIQMQVLKQDGSCFDEEHLGHVIEVLHRAGCHIERIR